jgi:hypothetical protein
MEMEDWKAEVAEELEHLIKHEYNELNTLINAIEANSDDFDSILVESSKHSRNVASEMALIIRQQQALINSLRAYSQDLEDLYKSSHFKMQSLIFRDSPPSLTCTD